MALFFSSQYCWTLIRNEEYFYIYLTDWGLTLLTIYFIWSSISVTVRFMQQNCPPCYDCPRDEGLADMECELSPRPTGCCGKAHNSLQWYEIVNWFLFIVGAELAVSITFLYWPLFYNVEKAGLFSYLNIVVHLLNGVAALLDLWISRIPVRIYHFIYLMIISITYTSFSGVYFATGGTDGHNHTYIYPQLDYGGSPGQASALAVGGALVYIPFIHLFFYCNYLCREGLLYCIRYCKIKMDQRKGYTVMIEDSITSSGDREENANVVWFLKADSCFNLMLICEFSIIKI